MIKKKLITLLIVVGMLISAGGCSGTIAGSTALKVVTITGIAGTTGAITFDKELYKELKKYDWFMIDPADYMPNPIKRNADLSG